MSKDNDTYINNELKKLNGYANYLLDFNNKYKQDITGITRNTLAGTSQGLTQQSYDRKLQSALGQVMTLYNELKAIGEKGKNNPDLEADIKAFRKKLYEADLPIFEGSTDKQDEIYNLLGYAEIKKELEHPKWIIPVPRGHRITSYHGYRIHPVLHDKRFHDGIDINAFANTPVYAVADGFVVKAEWYNGYGNYIEIDHGNGIHSFYGHLNKIYVTKGMRVSQGQTIALSGNTGLGTGEHLHFGVHKKGDTANPLEYLPGF